MGGDIGRNDRQIGGELPTPRLEMREIGLVCPAGGVGNAPTARWHSHHGYRRGRR